MLGQPITKKQKRERKRERERKEREGERRGEEVKLLEGSMRGGRALRI